MNIQFRENPGIIYDFAQIIMCKSEKREKWISIYVTERHKMSDVREIDNILSSFTDLNPRMLLFGYRDPKKGSFISNLLLKYLSETETGWSIDEFICFITKPERLKKEVLEFYFNKSSDKDIFQCIREDTDLDDHIKNILYEFAIFMTNFIDERKQELYRVEKEINSLRNQFSRRILEIQNEFEYDSLDIEGSAYARSKKWDQGLKTVTISFAVINKHAAIDGKKGPAGWIILGIDYLRTIHEGTAPDINVAAFGNAIGDNMRVKILQTIVKDGECTLADLSKKLGVVNTVIMYHLDILKKESLLLYRSQGRKVLYCINYSQFDRSLRAIKSIYGGIDNEKMETALFDNH